MLRIHEVTSATDAKRYYAASDYYSEGQELVGSFGGKLAERLDLSGIVDKATFDRLCDNLHPHNDNSLTPRTNEERRVGKDFVFSGPKSFSVLEALAPEEERQRLLAAFNDAITETLTEAIEPDVCTRVRKNGADSDRLTGNMLWAEFDHSTSRPVNDNTPPDPHRHKHVLVFNATYDPVERRIKAGQFGDIKADGEYYTAVFYSKLAARLEEMGYAIDRRGGKVWEIAGVPQSVLQTFSKRTNEIESVAEEQGITNADRKAELGAKTRASKQKELTPAQLRKAWDAQLTDAERRALAAVYRKELPASEPVSPAKAVAYAIEHCSEQRSVFPDRELKRLALLQGLGHVTLEEVMPELLRQGVLLRQIDGKWWATTSQLMAEEDRIVGLAAGGRGTVEPVGVPEGLERGTLNDGQWQAVSGLLNSSNRVNLVEGPAGAGKSYMLQRFDQGMRMAGQDVTYLATTTDAADVLAKDGFTVNTVARFLLDEKLQNAAQGCRVVIDETSMLGHKDAVKLFDLAEKNDLKLIFVGDPLQHGSVPRGALLHVLKDYAGIQPFQLRDIMRQEDPTYRAAVQSLSEGNTLEGFDALHGLGWVHEIGDATHRYQLLAADYVRALEELKALPENKRVLVVSPTHAEAAKITAEIRSQLKAAGKLGPEDREFTRLVAANASEAERGQATTYRPGDVLVFHQNGKGVKKGDRMVVRHPADVPVSEASKFQLYRPETIRLAEGDKLRFTGTAKTVDGKHVLKNGAIKAVAGFDAKGNIRLENGWVIGADAGMFRHGFVDTSFGSQGKTVQRVLLGMAASSLQAMNQEQMYVSASRGKEWMKLYTDDADAVRSAVQRSSAKPAALDLRQTEKQGLLERLRKLLERRRRHGLVHRMRAAWDRQDRSSPLPPRMPTHSPVTHRERVTTRTAERDGSYGR